MKFALAAAGVLIGAAPLAASATGSAGRPPQPPWELQERPALALVTTMPETTVTFGALRLGAEGMALGNVYGSCAFNVVVLALADLLHPRPLFRTLDQSQLVAGSGLWPSWPWGLSSFPKTCALKAFGLGGPGGVDLGHVPSGGRSTGGF